MSLSMEGVLALAPDESSAKAARGLLAPAGWPSLGANAAAVWGECKGSGAKPYQTQVDLAGPAFRCSCPSRKFPCKHGLALLMLHVQQQNLFEAADAPAWVDEWLNSRQEKAQKKEERQQAAVAPDPQAALKREAQRWTRIEQAAQDLQRWLADQLARGLGAQQGEALKAWQTMSARLVDAQVPGLAQRLREAMAGLHQGTDWPERSLHRLGLLQLACEALQRRAELSPALQDELRSLAGWPHDKAEVLSQGERIEDRWIVLGSLSEARDDRLTERRVWLHGVGSGRRAWLLDHAFGGQGFEQSWLVGACMAGPLSFYPGTAGLRALAAEGLLRPEAALAPPTRPIEDEWLMLGRRVAASPWVGLHPMLLGAATLLRGGEGWLVAAQGQVLPARIADADAWSLLACRGGAPSTLMGEWDGQVLRPLSAWADGSTSPDWQCGSPA